MRFLRSIFRRDRLPFLLPGLLVVGALAFVLPWGDLFDSDAGKEPKTLKVNNWADGKIVILANGHREDVAAHDGVGTNVRDIDMNPDGSLAAFTKGDCATGSRSIYTLPGGSTEATELEGSDEYSPIELDWNSKGTTFVFRGLEDEQIYVMDSRGGKATQLTVPSVSAGGVDNAAVHATRFREPTWSPDDSRIAFTAYDAERKEWDLWVMEPDGSDAQQLTDADSYAHPSWHPDGEFITIARTDTNGVSAIVDIRIDGSGGEPAPKQRDTAGTWATSPAWSPDGRLFAYVIRREDGTGFDVVFEDLDDDAPRTFVTPAGESDVNPRFTVSGAGLLISSATVEGRAPGEHGVSHLSLDDPTGGGHVSGAAHSGDATSPVPECAMP